MVRTETVFDKSFLFVFEINSLTAFSINVLQKQQKQKMSTVNKFNFSSLLVLDGGAGTGDELHDVVFVIPTVNDDSGKVVEKKIKAHQFVLSLVSGVFKRQFYGALPDVSQQPSDQGRVKTIEITDFTYSGSVMSIFHSNAFS